MKKNEKICDSKIPYIVELTEKGIKFALSHNEKKEIDWKELFISIVPCAIELGMQYVSNKINS